VLLAWVLVFAGLAGAATIAGTQVNDNLTLPGTGSQDATDLLNERFPSEANGINPVVLVAADGSKLTDSKYKDPIDDAVNAFKENPDVESVTSPLSSAGSAQLSKDEQTGYIALNLKTSASDLTEDDADQLVDESEPAKKAGLDVSYGGYVGQELSTPATESSEVVGLMMAVIVLLFTFGTFVAMGLPIVTALFGLGCGLSIITLLGHVAQVPTVAPTLATMIGLGVGIDYALFVVTRHRDTLHEGMDVNESIARATATSGGAVVFAGCTVIIALLSLAIVDIPLVTTLGYTAALVVAVAVLAAITLLPAILALVGWRIESLKVPGLHHNPADNKPHGWRRWGTFIADHPWPALVVSLVVLCALAAPVLGLYLGQQDDGSLPKSTQSRQSYDALAKGLGVGQNGPFLISVDMAKEPAKADQSQIDDIDKQEDQQKQQAENPATDPRLQTLRTDLGKTSGVASVSQPLVNDDGTAAILNLIPTTSPSDEKTADLVTTLRDDTIPAATKGADMTAYVGGSTAGYVDLASEISDRLVLTIAVVIGLSFLLLVLAFRSIVIPITAGLMNLISIGAAFGVVTLVFEDGHGASLIGLDGPVPIVSYVPLMMFAVLFGLSMDYEVFLISHIREGWQELKDNKLAVIDGIATTGRVITSAALIMVSVFFAFILNGDPTIKQFGVGMGVAVMVDATLVRCALVPAVMVLLGNANWWFPKWLDRILPDLSIEGKEYFRQLDEAGMPVPATNEPAAHTRS
jgi:RND superfamily putative drug exporter